jgi:hypothetical protein
VAPSFVLQLKAVIAEDIRQGGLYYVEHNSIAAVCDREITGCILYVSTYLHQVLGELEKNVPHGCGRKKRTAF